MNQLAMLQDIRALQEWLRDAWRQLGNPSLTAFARRELRNQMKQCSADLRLQLQQLAESQRSAISDPVPLSRKPELRL